MACFSCKDVEIPLMVKDVFNISLIFIVLCQSKNSHTVLTLLVWINWASVVQNSFLFVLRISTQARHWCTPTRVPSMGKALWITKGAVISSPADCFEMSFSCICHLKFCCCYASLTAWEGKALCHIEMCLVSFGSSSTTKWTCFCWQFSAYSCFWQLLFVLCMEWEGLLDESREKVSPILSRSSPW